MTKTKLGHVLPPSTYAHMDVQLDKSLSWSHTCAPIRIFSLFRLVVLIRGAAWPWGEHSSIGGEGDFKVRSIKMKKKNNNKLLLLLLLQWKNLCFNSRNCNVALCKRPLVCSSVLQFSFTASPGLNVVGLWTRSAVSRGKWVSASHLRPI